MSDVRLAIAGVGNCASALVQGTVYYANKPNETLIHQSVGGYSVGDITPVCGFDVDERKVGHDIADAVTMDVNEAERFADLPDSINAPVYRGPLLDGADADTLGGEDHSNFSIDESRSPVDVAAKLEAHDIDVLACYLPVGSQCSFKP